MHDEKFTRIKFRVKLYKSLPNEIVEMENLQEIYLVDNKFKEFPSILFKMKNLKSISISSKLLSQTIHQKLENMQIKVYLAP